MYAKVLLTTHCARPSLIGPLELADMGHHISQSVSVLNITPYGNILINKYQGLIICSRLTPLQKVLDTSPAPMLAYESAEFQSCRVPDVLP